jgi:hypothetical protein
MEMRSILTTSNSLNLIPNKAKDKDKSTPSTTAKAQAREKSPATTMKLKCLCSIFFHAGLLGLHSSFYSF